MMKFNMLCFRDEQFVVVCYNATIATMGFFKKKKKPFSIKMTRNA